MRLTVLGCAGTFPGPDSPCSGHLVSRTASAWCSTSAAAMSHPIQAYGVRVTAGGHPGL